MKISKSVVSLYRKPMVDTGVSEETVFNHTSYWSLYEDNVHVGTFSRKEMFDYVRSLTDKHNFRAYPRLSLRQNVTEVKYQVNVYEQDELRYRTHTSNLQCAMYYAKVKDTFPIENIKRHYAADVISLEDGEVLYQYVDGKMTYSYRRNIKK